VALPPEIETALALTVREAVTNVQRHAQARTARVVLRHEDGNLLLRIEDDGRGGAILPGNCLAGMRERLAGIGAELRIDSGSRGTVVATMMPSPGPMQAVPAPALREA
jgi:two-component system sensor histidine kinase DesK